MSARTVVITGADGFIGRNLRWRLHDLRLGEIVPVTRQTTEAELDDALRGASFVFHLAGANRPPHPDGFAAINVGFTQQLCAALRRTGRAVPVAFASSTQAALDNPYGRSKRDAEAVVVDHAGATGARIHILRLPNVFGKWSRPDYNSVVATFCHRIARDLPVEIHDPSAPLRLLHVDDAVAALVDLLDLDSGATTPVPGPVHETTVGDVARALRGFREIRNTSVVPPVGTGLMRALYSTYVSFLPVESFSYRLERHEDPRGVFVEMLKTHDSGQFSFLTARPGVTRGEHYHHTKTEKFLVIRGTARFGFRHVDTGERTAVTVAGDDTRVVETIPGWAHDIANVGDDELIVMLWANEVFDRARPDTIAMKVEA